ncbi:HAD hydrolase-like protein [uncultured Ilyobacter sp.]|uniref:HAD hydrolase-like protein n=1 Tax=uncultured Ilyobacter sp. TaxID=544433 RepID=UPI0029C8C69C|nr:HAD hydrolase-like protein [uncultured Ilyobacter sp.]
MIRNVVFDLGQVLFRFTPKHYLEKEFSSEKIDLIYKEVFRDKEWEDLSRGLINSEEAARRIASRSSVPYGEAKKILDDRKSFITPIDDNLKILEKLGSNGYKIFLLADFHEDILNEYLNEIPMLQQVYGKVISSEINILKSEKEMYNYFLKKYQLIPKETLLIDDSKHNITNATYFGIKGIVLKKPEDLSVELEKLEIL